MIGMVGQLIILAPWAILVLMMIFRPAGLLPEPRRAMELEHADAELPKIKEVEDAA